MNSNLETTKPETLLPMKLQFFAEDSTPPSDPPKDDPAPPNDPPKDEGKPEPPTDGGKDEKTLNITQEALNALNAKAKGKGAQSVLKKLGVENEEDLEGVLQILNDYRTQKEEEEKNKPLLEKLQGELAAANKTIEENAPLLEKLRLYEQKEAVNKAINEMYGKTQGLDLKSVDSDYIIFLANQKVSDDVTFEEAVKEVLKEKPPAVLPPEMPGGPGTSPAPSPSEAEALKAQYKEAEKLHKNAEMSRIIRLAKEKNIKLF